ncbi:hydrolase [Sphingomonas sp. S2-65]|uniref:hydrolase n=1 Tax=Sphingomonas sp. S2-65 TaxID=2903960 RepID=UPI001F1FA535|nr:hydrolase [Sphingomonas sp. S2-65]UYY58952.1 hydrolase [Sphingomonas sp. S2-65]
MIAVTDLERDAIAHVGAAPMLAQTESWVAINSGTRNLAGLRTMAGLLADAFAVLPGALSLIEPDPVESVSPAGQVEQLAHGQHLRLSVRPDAPLQLLFTGHMDTVYPVDHPFQSARWLPDGTLNGPGAADMKGGLAVMLAALQAVEASPLAPRLGYDVVINSDEETGSFASAALIARAARGKHVAFTYEPALPDGTLAGARGGTGNFSLIVRGRSAHAGRNPETGRNALVAAADLAVRLASAGTPALSVNPARIDGGGPNNVVPELAILRVNFRPRAQEAIDDATTAIQRIVESVSREHEVRIEVHGSFNRPPKPLDPRSLQLFHLVQGAGAALGLQIAWKATGGVCDGNNIAACGVPVIDTMGVRGGAIHSMEEFLIPDSLAERAALSAISILRLAERGGL